MRRLPQRRARRSGRRDDAGASTLERTSRGVRGCPDCRAGPNQRDLEKVADSRRVIDVPPRESLRTNERALIAPPAGMLYAMAPHRVRGPYEEDCAGDEAYQLAYHGCRVGDLVALAHSRNVKVEHILAAVTRGARRRNTVGKIASARMGGGQWLWEISLNGGQTDVPLGRNPTTQVKIVNARHS
jgi:hypothetical protein